MGENGQLNPDLPIRVRCGRDWDSDGVRIGSKPMISFVTKEHCHP